MWRSLITAMMITAGGILCVSCCALGVGDGKVRVPYKRSEDAIRTALLRYTPMGTAKGEVVKFIRTRLVCDDTIRESMRFGGWERNGSGKLVRIEPRSYLSVEVGNYPGVYGFPIHVYVWAEWGFDDGGILKELEVKREIDAP